MIKNYAEEIDYPIPSELQGYIFAALFGETDTAIQTTIPVHPTGFPLLVYVFNDISFIHIDGNRQPQNERLTVDGQIDKVDIALEIDGKFGQVGLVLSPTAPYYLFHKPGIHFSNRRQNFETALAPGLKSLTHQLSKCETSEERLAILIDIIASLHKNKRPPIEWLDASVACILSKNGIVSQSELSAVSGIGTRHFRRKFKQIIGVAPKYYCKVIQMNTIFQHLKSSNIDELHHLALDCGYYDQAHFVNDFTRLIGSSPSHFLSGEHAYVQTYMGRKDYNGEFEKK